MLEFLVLPASKFVRSLDMPSGETLNWRCIPGVPRGQLPYSIDGSFRYTSGDHAAELAAWFAC